MKSIGTVTGLTVFIFLIPFVATFLLAKLTYSATELWSPQEFGITFTVIHLAFTFCGAWLYAKCIGN